MKETTLILILGTLLILMSSLKVQIHVRVSDDVPAAEAADTPPFDPSEPALTPEP